MHASPNTIRVIKWKRITQQGI